MGHNSSWPGIEACSGDLGKEGDGMTTILIIIAVLLYFFVGVLVAMAAGSERGALIMLSWPVVIVASAIIDVVLLVGDLIGE